MGNSQSKYHLSTSTLICIPTLIVLTAAANIFYMVCLALLQSDSIDIFKFYDYLDISVKVILGLDFTLSISILSLMVWKLHQVTVSLDADIAMEYDEIHLNAP